MSYYLLPLLLPSRAPVGCLAVCLQRPGTIPKWSWRFTFSEQSRWLSSSTDTSSFLEVFSTPHPAHPPLVHSTPDVASRSTQPCLLGPCPALPSLALQRCT
ncbi:hypothetical protein BD289DRAFT_445956 [Coniella lustricola]|uniref:Secreted protein n=1 Tax=Coniella lustricola TaxID=2025994 RepID=A0A2T2ZUC4_9PEZI|nr:hypothetical protein BD289DRAFT_445956 [Coniella lustricola]